MLCVNFSVDEQRTKEMKTVMDLWISGQTLE